MQDIMMRWRIFEAARAGVFGWLRIAALWGVATHASGTPLPESFPSPGLPSHTMGPGPSDAILDGVVDPDAYVVGPGDQLEVLVLGDAQERILEWVGPSGAVVVMPAGVIDVAGLSLSAATRAIVAQLSPFYPGSVVTVQLRNIRRFRVRVLGEVPHPGEYLATPLTRASDLLLEAEGLVQFGPLGVRVAVAGALGELDGAGGVGAAAAATDVDDAADATVAEVMFPEGDAQASLLRVSRGLGSRRAVTLERRGREPRAVDLVGAVRGWPGKEDPLLLDGDRLIVPPLLAQITVSGAVNAPGRYELLPGESLADVVRLAGGMKPTAEPRAWVQRGYGAGTRFVVALVDASSERIRSGDRVHIVDSRDRSRDERVVAHGAVAFPGAYPFLEGDTVEELLEMAGGWSSDAVPEEAYVLRNGDKFDRDAQAIRIEAIPDSLRSHEEWEYLIQHQSRADRAVYLDLTRIEEGAGLVLTAGDELRIPSRDDLVYVTGAVMRPGGLPWRAGAPYEDYLERSGGSTDRADLSEVRVLVGSTGGWLNVERSTEIRPGDTVWVPGKVQRDYWALFREIVTVVGQVATTYLVIEQLQSDD